MSRILMKDRSIRKNRKKLFGILAIAFIFLVVVFYVTVAKSGYWLVQNDEFTHVKWAVLLDGQTADLERDDFAAKLMSEGKIDSIVILGRRVYRDKSNADFYAEDFMRLGMFDSSAVFLARHDDPSTISEAYTIIPWLKNRKADTVLLLTSAAATHRVANLFKELAGERPVFLTADIHHYLYDANTWYINRESRKSWLREWAALLYSKFELIGLDTLTAADSTYYVPIRSVSEEKNMEPVVDLQKFLKQANSKTQEVINNAAKDTTKAVETAKKDSSKSESKAEPKKDDKKDVKKEEPKKQEPKKDEKKETKKDEPKKEEKKDSKKEEPKKDDKKDNKSSSDKKKDEKKS